MSEWHPIAQAVCWFFGSMGVALITAAIAMFALICWAAPHEREYNDDTANNQHEGQR